MKLAIKNRFTNKIQFTASIDCDETAMLSTKIGLSIKWAIKHGADLTRTVLMGADLTDADLTGANLMNADLTNTVLTDTNLTRANLRGADLTGANLTRANLRGADLTGANLRGGANLTNTDLTGADLTGTILRSAILRDANLTEADLTDTNLRSADLTGAVLPKHVPVVPAIDRAILAAIEAGGCLEMKGWHKCNTTHCRAGWAIHLAGAAGAALENEFGSAAAGALIYAKSRPGKPIPNFYASNDEALESIRRDAAEG